MHGTQYNHHEPAVAVLDNQVFPRMKQCTLDAAAQKELALIDWTQAFRQTADAPSYRELLRIGTAAEIKKLAALRALPEQAVRKTQQRGLVRFGEFWGQPVWAATDRSGECNVLRRLDGQLWSQGRKAIMLPGSKGCWPIGILEARDTPVAFLVEGGPDLVAAHVGIREHECVICMPSVSGRFGRLAWLLRDAVIFIFSHPDQPGKKAAETWKAELLAAKAHEVFLLHSECGDLNDHLKAGGTLGGLKFLDERPSQKQCGGDLTPGASAEFVTGDRHATKLSSTCSPQKI
jgi:hypothetical protein